MHIAFPTAAAKIRWTSFFPLNRKMLLRPRKRRASTPIPKEEVELVPELLTDSAHAVYQILPYPADDVEVVYTKDPVEAEAWLKNNVIDCNASAIGFDIEWKPQFTKKKDGGVQNKTSVLQLAVESSCLVLHLRYMAKMPKVLEEVLKKEEIKKVGSGILQDMTKLKRDKGIECKGRADTQTMAQRLGVSRSDGVGLQKLSERFLGVQIKKPKKVSMSNWEKFPLSYAQIEYAAMDAWLGLKLFNCMKQLADERKTFVEDPLEEEQSVPTTVGGVKERIHECSNDGDQSQYRAQSQYRSCTKIVICEGCGKKCKGKDSLAEHLVKAAHVICQSCGKMFPSVIPKKHRSCGFTCELCGKQCPGAATLEEHKKSAHLIVRCWGCGQMFYNKVSKKHRKSCGTLKCGVCSKWLTGEEELLDHMKVAHVTCQGCGVVFQNTVPKKHILRCTAWQSWNGGKMLSTNDDSDEVEFIREVKKQKTSQ